MVTIGLADAFVLPVRIGRYILSWHCYEPPDTVFTLVPPRSLAFVVREDNFMRPLSLAASYLALLALALPSWASITIKDRTVSQPLVLDQMKTTFFIRFTFGRHDMAALTLTERSIRQPLKLRVFQCVGGSERKAVTTEAQGAIVGSFVATDTAFEDAQHQLLCLREGPLARSRFSAANSARPIHS